MNRIDGDVVNSAVSAATTGSLPEHLLEPAFVAHDTALAHPGKYLLVSFNISGAGSMLILNRDGRIVWYHTSEGGHLMLVPRVARSGDHLMFDIDTYWSGGGGNPTSTINRVTIANEIIESIEVPDLHHGWDEFGDGTIIWGKNPSGTAHEELWAKDPAEVLKVGIERMRELLG